MNDIEKPAALKMSKCSGFSVRKKRGRKVEKGQRLTASVAFHKFRIMDKYVETMTDYKRKCKSEIKNGLKFNSLREGLLPHNAPHLINVGQCVEILVIVRSRTFFSGAHQRTSQNPVDLPQRILGCIAPEDVAKSLYRVLSAAKICGIADVSDVRTQLVNDLISVVGLLWSRIGIIQ